MHIADQPRIYSNFISTPRTDAGGQEVGKKRDVPWWEKHDLANGEVVLVAVSGVGWGLDGENLGCSPASPEAHDRFTVDCGVKRRKKDGSLSQAKPRCVRYHIGLHIPK